jgi:GrpB-like predicted nucleotidyltransferase (UPF0157 family)
MLRLIGAMQTSSGEWDLDAFGALFGRLKCEVPHEGSLLRYVGYQGTIDNRIEVRFFGVEVDRIEHIPDGMVGWELRDDSWSVSCPDGTQNELGELTWQWTDSTPDPAGPVSAPPRGGVGEFTAQLPEHAEPVEAHFRMTSNAYFDRDKPLDDEIRLEDYDPSWPAQYDEAAKRLREGLGPNVALRIEHYGSTAIPDMPAKPVIDLLVEVPSLDAARRSGIPFFNKVGCEYWWHGDHVYFMIRERPMGKRTHHIHMAPAGHQLWDGLIFRDYLRTHPLDAARYAALKCDLAARHRTDRERYTDAKHEFVMEILDLAVR